MKHSKYLVLVSVLRNECLKTDIVALRSRKKIKDLLNESGRTVAPAEKPSRHHALRMTNEAVKLSKKL